MDRIVVTGVAGLLGGAVAAHLAAAGRAVLGLDRRRPEVSPSFVVEIDDLSDVARLRGRLDGATGVVHCAAIARPQEAPETVVFDNNVTTTAHVAFAAEQAGVRRLVYASSQSALGLAYAPAIVPPDYVPVDEDHPARPGEGYGLSKLVGERICAMVVARSTLSCVALRFPVIWSADRFEECVRRRIENPVQAAKSQWAYIDLRDAARACALALDADMTAPFAILNAAAAWPFEMPEPERTLDERYGVAMPRQDGWGAGDPVFDVRRARDVLRFVAGWRWTSRGIERMET